MFKPDRVIIEEKALNYEMGERLYNRFLREKVEIVVQKTGNMKYREENKILRFNEGKKTLILGIRKGSKMESCKPSADYQLPLLSGCPGLCEYCYLNTRMGKSPYIKAYVNIKEILEAAIKISKGEVTSFEASASSDPIAIEHYTNSIRDTILYFNDYNNINFRFVTKYTSIESLLDIGSNKTNIRFSLNTEEIIKKYENKTPSLKERILASEKVLESGYKLGFIIAPVFIYEGYKEDYKALIQKLGSIYKNEKVEFEIISHRFTTKGKETTVEIFPSTVLPLNEENRKFKYGQFGYGKYVYKDEEIREMKDFFTLEIEKNLPYSNIKYII